MTIHICNDQLLTIEASTEETPDEATVKKVIGRTLAENGIYDWSSLEISEFTDHGKRFIMAVPVKVYIPRFLAALAGDLS